jgi:hypothetical protein
MEIEHFAKIYLESGNAGGFTRRDFENALHKRAEATRLPGESRQQAFTRAATADPQGRALFKAAVKGPFPVESAQDLAPRTAKPAPGPASEELAALARKHARERRISYQQAYTRLLTDPNEGHAELAARVRAEERQASAAVRDARDPIWAAERENERPDFRLGRSRGSARM